MTIDDMRVDAEDVANVYLHQLRDLLTEPATHRVGDSAHVRGKIIGSPAPWNDEAANLIFEIHAGTRRHEARLRLELGFNPIRRGDSDQQTHDSIVAIPYLAIAIATRVDLDHGHVDRAAHDLDRWGRLSRRILDEDPRPHERPNTHAPGNLCCPHCSRRLILKHGWQFEKEGGQDLWCLRCPTTIDDEHPRGRDLSWPAAAWIAVLQQDPGVSG